MYKENILCGAKRLQNTKGSPVYPDIHVQSGRWFTTWQWVFDPQVPGHGFMHLFLMQALL